MALAAPVGSEYNSGMKTAISIPEAVYQAGERLANRLKLSRSRLYALALADYIERHADDTITQRLNAAFAAHPTVADPFVREAAHRTLERNEW
jgi:metal-responsive CopG/Arc/MetJ family transcriptional regulator